MWEIKPAIIIIIKRVVKIHLRYYNSYIITCMYILVWHSDRITVCNLQGIAHIYVTANETNSAEDNYCCLPMPLSRNDIYAFNINLSSSSVLIKGSLVYNIIKKSNFQPNVRPCTHAVQIAY